MRFLLYIILFLTLVSCKESQKDKITNLVKEWDGKEILFPSNTIFTIKGRDTVDFQFMSADYKIVTYVDSIGCVSCKLQLSSWKDLIHEIDSLTGQFIPFTFFFHTKDFKELKYITRRDNFDYPICLDLEDTFNTLNHFPDKIEFQTFLIDCNNRVVAIGNPIHNPKVKELYLKIITGKDLKMSKTTMTEVTVDTTDIDLGLFPKESRQERKFVLTNTGQNVLVIHDVITSCGCIKVSYDKEPVRSGGKAKITVTYEAEKYERFYKTIIVYCNSCISPLKLTIKGEAI